MPVAKAKTAPKNDAPEYAPAWRPEPGDSITGTVAEFFKNKTEEYGEYPGVTLDTANGQISVHAFAHVLRRGLASIRPAVGTELKITYHGKVDGKDGGNAYHNYTVSPSNPGAAFWG